MSFMPEDGFFLCVAVSAVIYAVIIISLWEGAKWLFQLIF
jgi:hypothetical protein